MGRELKTDVHVHLVGRVGPPSRVPYLIHLDTITGWFIEFIAKNDLPHITILSLRHANITLLIAAGVPLRTVSYRTSHAQTSTSSNIYSHAIKTSDEIASEALDDILIPKGNKGKTPTKEIKSGK